MPATPPISSSICFGPFELDVAAGELRKAGTPIKLQPQPFRLLLLLVERAGTVVTREEIQRCLWSDSTFVDFEHGINFSINQIRGAPTIRENEGQYLYLARRYDEAIAKADRILEIEPNFAWAYFDRGLSYEQKGKWREALADLETARRLDDAPFNAAVLAEGYALSGDKGRARQILGELQARAKREDVSALYPAIVHAGLGEKDAAFAGLEEAFQERSTYLLALKSAAFYDPLRSDPRFDGLLKRMGVPQ